MQTALRGDLLQEGAGRAETRCRMESTQDQGLLVTDTQVRNTSSKTRSDELFGDRPRFLSSLRRLLSLFSGQETLHFYFCCNKLICASQPPAGREAVLSGTPFPAARWRPSSFEQQLLAGHSSSPIRSSVPTEAPSGTEAAFPAPALELESSPESLTF